jgi:hypothetical protein
MARSIGCTSLLLPVLRPDSSFTHTSIYTPFLELLLYPFTSTYMIRFLAIVLTTEIPSRGSEEAEETAQVVGAGDNQVKVGDVAAGMQNRA